MAKADYERARPACEDVGSRDQHRHHAERIHEPEAQEDARVQRFRFPPQEDQAHAERDGQSRHVLEDDAARRGPYGHAGTSAPHSTWSSSASTAATRSARDVKERPAPGANDGTFASVMVER
jgi:hypothetical protein